MYSYIDIKRRENELVQKKNLLQEDRVNLLSPLYELKEKHPDIFR